MPSLQRPLRSSLPHSCLMCSPVQPLHRVTVTFNNLGFSDPLVPTNPGLLSHSEGSLASSGQPGLHGTVGHSSTQQGWLAVHSFLTQPLDLCFHSAACLGCPDLSSPVTERQEPRQTWVELLEGAGPHLPEGLYGKRPALSLSPGSGSSVRHDFSSRGVFL